MTIAGRFGLVIFDCDGVLIDSEVLASRVDADELMRIGYPITHDEVVLRFTGLSAASMRKDIEADWGRPLPADFETIVQARIKESYRTDLRPIDGIKEVLRRLPLPCCVASSSAPDKLRLGLELTDLLPNFEPHIFSASMVSAGKPAPDLFLFAASRMGVEPHRCVVVEDSIAGVRAGVAAGMTVIGFTAGGHCLADHADRLKEHGASLVTGSSSELCEVLCSFATG